MLNTHGRRVRVWFQIAFAMLLMHAVQVVGKDNHVQIQIVNRATDGRVAIYEPEEPEEGLDAELIGTLGTKGQSVSILTYVGSEYEATVETTQNTHRFTVKDKPVSRYEIRDEGVDEIKHKDKNSQREL
jgi:hypothetical protein